MNRKECLGKLLERLMETIRRSSANEIEELLLGRAALVISSETADNRRATGREAVGKKREQRSSKNLNEIAVQLRQLESREDGATVLNRAQLTKKELEELARLMDLPVLRDDDANRLKQKIVEASIGARLNSQAIRGG